jgi:general nucleoside transport system ATP-binding protein
VTIPALELTGISKRFGSVHALRGADFTLMPGEVHALLGENGAGKTTLMHVAYGLIQPDAGELRIAGALQRSHSPRAARRLGIGMVHQHFTSVPAFTVAENVALAAGWPVAPATLDRRVRQLCERIGLPLEPGETVARLSVGLKQRLEIVKALAGDARVLLLDEPTAVLAPAEVEELLGVIRRFAAQGGAAVLITHKLDEALAAAERVTVLRKGRVVGSGPVSSWSPARLTEAMIGGEVESPARASSRVGDRAMIHGESLDIPRESGLGIAVRGASFTVRSGEIVGVAAVEGNGQRELLRAVAGRSRPLRGRLEVSRPIGFVPEDRTSEGLIPEFSLAQNLVLGSAPGDPWIVGHRVDWEVARSRTAALIEQFGVVATGPDAPASSLSGGNQQKLVLARELSRKPAVVVAENPTRGLDVRAAEEIYGRLRESAAAGAAVLFYSSDLDEVLALSHRIIVLARGTLLEVPAGASRTEIGALMLAVGR